MIEEDNILKERFIPKNAMHNFQCSECCQLLSIGPVHLNLDGRSICGRCVNEINTEMVPPVRNYAYEAAANSYLFPCIFKSTGCPDYLPFNDPTKHEACCFYRMYKCPYDSCIWKGVVKELPKHYQKEHKDLYVEGSSVEFKLQDSFQPFVIYYHCLYFVLQINRFENKEKLWFNLIYLDDAKDAEFIQYVIKLEGCHTKTYITLEEQSVLPHSYLQTNSNKSVDIDVAGIVTILKHPEKVKCTLSINVDENIQIQKLTLEMLRCPNCSNYMESPIYRCKLKHVCCADCKGFEMDCTCCKDIDVISALSRTQSIEELANNIELPCRWTGCPKKSKMIRQHEQVCPLRTYVCPLESCIDWSGSLSNLIEHLKITHSHSKVHVMSDGCNTIYNKGSYDYIIAHGEIFGCNFVCSENEGGLFQIYYKGRPSLASNFVYEIQMLESNKIIEIYPLTRFIKNRYEVYVPLINIKSRIDYKINITKRCEFNLDMNMK